MALYVDANVQLFTGKSLWIRNLSSGESSFFGDELVMGSAS